MNWRRNKYHLNFVFLLLPVMFAGSFLSDWKPGPHDGAVRLPARSVGDWRAHAYVDHFEPGGLLDVHARFDDGSYEEIRAAFVAVDDAPPERSRLFDIAYSAILHGGKNHLEAHVPVPRTLSGRESLWLTVEGWDGRFYRTSWPLPAITTGKANRNR